MHDAEDWVLPPEIRPRKPLRGQLTLFDMFEENDVCVEIEKWLPIITEGVKPNHYEISNWGNVRSCDRKVATRTGIKNFRGQKIATHPCGNGYLRVRFSGDFGNLKCSSRAKTNKMYSVHVLVAEAFVGPPPHPDMMVDHGDSDKQNNRADNLQWVTPIENARRAKQAKPARLPFKDDDDVQRKTTYKRPSSSTDSDW